MERFERHVQELADDAAVDRQTVYRAAHIATQGRVTSVPEAIHLVLGQETVLISRGNVWVQVGGPETWTRRVLPCEEMEALMQADVVAEERAPVPAAHKSYMNRLGAGGGAPPDGNAQFVMLPVEGGDPVSVPLSDVTFFDFLAGTAGGRPRTKPAIVGHRTIHPDQEPEAYYYHKLLLFKPWTKLDDLKDAEPGTTYQSSFQRMVMQNPSFLQSVCFPQMDLRVEAARELARLQAALVVRCALEGNAAQELLEGHLQLASALRAHTDAADLDADVDDDVAGTVAETLFADVPGGAEVTRLELLCVQRSLFAVSCANETKRGTRPARRAAGSYHLGWLRRFAAKPVGAARGNFYPLGGMHSNSGAWPRRQR